MSTHSLRLIRAAIVGAASVLAGDALGVALWVSITVGACVNTILLITDDIRGQR